MAYIVSSGNLTNPPDLGHDSESGRPYAYVRVAVNDRARDESGEWINVGTQFYALTVRGDQAQRLAAAAQGGNIRVLFAGTLRVREYTRKDGTKAVSNDVWADQIGVDLGGLEDSEGRQ